MNTDKLDKMQWPTEFWCNGELQVSKCLSARQVQAITLIIESIEVSNEK